MYCVIYHLAFYTYNTYVEKKDMIEIFSLEFKYNKDEWVVVLYCLKIEVESDWQDYKGHVLDIVGECILKKLSLECDWSKIFQFGWYGSHKESGVSGFGALWLVPRLKGLTNQNVQCV
jgi:hypothetical protein